MHDAKITNWTQMQPVSAGDARACGRLVMYCTFGRQLGKLHMTHLNYLQPVGSTSAHLFAGRAVYRCTIGAPSARRRL